MRTVGIDLAAEPATTAACEVTWRDGAAHARVLTDRLDDDRLLAAIGSADKVGIDCPLGWPVRFVEAVAAHARGAPWPGRGLVGAEYRRSLRLRLTDQVVWQDTGLVPLSVSTDRIGVTAMRCAGLLDALAAAGREVDRSGTGLVVEVYPAATLKRWELPHRRYKTLRNADVLAQSLDRLLTMAPGLTLDEATRERCRRTDHAFDALVSALVARAAARGMTTPPRPGVESEHARVEGWIHLPTGGPGEL